MAKVDWITWKTNPNEIINPENIMETLNNSYKDYEYYFNTIIKESITGEISRGGLNVEAFNIMGISPANEEAKSILESVNHILEIMDKIKNNINQNVIEQKKIEKNQLIEELEKKLLEEENKMNNALNLKEKVGLNNSIVSTKDINDIITSSAERIKVIKEKIDIARAL